MLKIKDLVKGNVYRIKFADEYSEYEGEAVFVKPCSEGENRIYGGETGLFICDDEDEAYFGPENVVELIEKSEFAKIMDQLGIDGVDEETIGRLIFLCNNV